MRQACVFLAACLRVGSNIFAVFVRFPSSCGPQFLPSFCSPAPAPQPHLAILIKTIASNSFLFLVVRAGAPSSFLLLVASLGSVFATCWVQCKAETSSGQISSKAKHKARIAEVSPAFARSASVSTAARRR